MNRHLAGRLCRMSKLTPVSDEAAAIYAVRYADALIAALNKEGGRKL